MWHALAQLLPLGIAAAVSSIPIMATILILVSDKRREAGVPYLFGWVLGAALFVVIAMLAAGLLPESRARRHDTAVGTFQIAVGAGLIVLGLTALLAGRSKQAPELPRWLSRVDTLDSGPAFGLGVALNARPKALLLAAAAGLILHTASLASEATLIAIAFFTLVATSTVVIPVILTLVIPARMEPRLDAARDWLIAKGPALTAIMMVAIGIFIADVGLTHL
jgi:threonine/homoserine/homoserine lactone efflux protein